MNRRTHRHGAVALGYLCALAVTLGGCGSKEEAAPGGSAPSAKTDPLAGLTVHTYTVRGEIVSLPDAINDLQVRHEAIPEFKNPDGSMGMNTMIMPFWPPQGLSRDDARIAGRIASFSVEGRVPGEKVEVVFDVLWNADGTILGYYATSVTPLAPDTVLDFSPLESAP